ncbi:hypothetical protein STRAU_5567 [Streptomyces aurantiacus JA 4570]|uniref:Uncharacterized protein n=1 Tax=Streptomyces aurantiacus JA 4570 TaxID=1286094 RepID=S3ZCA8_9ACTN|nr:hypothetical protein STRAU_5567 [Streptomyces aurantiacus JA 4570]
MAGAAAAAVATMLVNAEPAAAAMPFGSVDPGTVSQFKLNQVVSGGGANGMDAAVEAVEKTGAVKNIDVSTLLKTGGNTGVAGLCHDTGLSASLKPGGYCWKKQDDTSSSWNATDGGWTPQGLSLPYSDTGTAPPTESGRASPPTPRPGITAPTWATPIRPSGAATSTPGSPW